MDQIAECYGAVSLPLVLARFLCARFYGQCQSYRNSGGNQVCRKPEAEDWNYFQEYVSSNSRIVSKEKVRVLDWHLNLRENLWWDLKFTDRVTNITFYFHLSWNCVLQRRVWAKLLRKHRRKPITGDQKWMETVFLAKRTVITYWLYCMKLMWILLQ